MLEMLYLMYYLFLSDPFLAVLQTSFFLSSHGPILFSTHFYCLPLSYIPLFSSILSPLLLPSFILPSLSLPSPDDSRTPALAQTWPTLTWNTRCAEDEWKEKEKKTGAERQFTFNSINRKKKSKWPCSCRPVVHHYFLTGMIWHFSHAKHFLNIRM